MVGKTIEFIQSHWETIAATIGGIGTAAGWLVRKVILPQVRRWQAEYANLVARLDTMQTSIEKIQQETQFNGGSTLRDAIKRIEVMTGYHQDLMMALQDLNGTPFWHSNQDGACVFASDALKRVIGNEALGNAWVSALHQSDTRRVQEAWLAAVHDRRPFREYYRFVHFDESIRYVCGTGRALSHYENGEYPGFVGTLQELTKEEWERRAAKQRRDTPKN